MIWHLIKILKELDETYFKTLSNNSHENTRKAAIFSTSIISLADIGCPEEEQYS
jgi:hypothetical protein